MSTKKREKKKNTNPHERFWTPPGIPRYALQRIAPQIVLEAADTCPWILEPGAGKGVWGEAARERWPNAEIIGVDLPDMPPLTPPYSVWFRSDYLPLAERWRGDRMAFDLIMGNLPFKLAERMIHLSLPLLRPAYGGRPGGSMLLLLRLAFLASQRRARSLWNYAPLRAIATLSRRPSFTGDGVTDLNTEYAIFWFQVGYRGLPELLPPFDYLEASNGTEAAA